MTTLTDFLLARIAEDEAIAKAAAWFDRGALAPTPVWTYAGDEVEPGVTCDHEGLSPAVNPEEGAHIALHDPARVFAECEAKRRIVSRCDMVLRGREHGMFNDGQAVDANDNLRSLAQVYADHPDFDPTWRLS